MFMSRRSIGNRVLRGSIGFSPVFATLIAGQPSPLAAATIAPSSLVSACSGVSLPASAVTSIMQPVISGVVSPIQSGLNGLLGILSGVNVDAAGLLSSAAAGQPITLKAVATDGTVLGSNSACYSQASGYTLAGTSGISIGGNQITGLGTGAVASAGETDSIAFGNNAVTAPTTVGTGAIAIGTSATVGGLGAGGVALGKLSNVQAANGVAVGSGAGVGLLGTNGVALGNGAIANTANSVALGGGSVADRIILGGAPAEVSIGSATTTRQLTHLAAGTADTDGVNLAQLNVVSAAGATNAQNIATLNTNVAANTQSIGTLQGGLATATANVGVLQTGLASANANVGALQSGLSSANATIGGLQTSVTANTAGLGVANGNIAALQGTLGNTVTAVGQLQTGLATANGTIGALQTNVNANTTGLVTANGNIGALQTSVAANTAGLSTANGNIAGLTTTVGTNTANIGTLTTNVAANTANLGTLTTNVGTNTANIAGLTTTVGTNTANIGTLTTNVAANTANLGTLTTNVGTNTANIAGLTTTVGTNTANIGTLTTNVAANTANLGTLTTTVGTNTANIAGLTTTVGTNTANIGTLTTNVAANTANLGTLTTSVGTNTANIAANTSGLTALTNAAVQYDDAGHTTLSLGGTGGAPVLLANVKAGTLAANSTQAVNGAQLLDTNNAVALNGTQIATINGKVLQNTGDIATANVTIGALGTALGQTTTATNTNTTDIANLTTTVDGHTNLLSQQGTAIGVNANAILALRNDTANGAIGPVQYSDPLAPTVPNGGTKTNDLTLVGRDPLPVRLHNVGDGVVAAGSKDGVNGGQLFALQTSVGSLSDLAVQYDDATRSTVTLSDALGGPVALRNIQAGTLSATSNDAVNGSQLFSTNQNLGNLQTYVDNQGDQLTTLSSQVSTGAIGPVQYSTAAAPTTPSGLGMSQDLTLVGLGGNPVGLHNVAQGTLSATSTDAVTGSQLFATNNQISSLAGLSVQYDDGFHSRVTFGGAGAAPVTLGNVAEGAVAANSTDAVNGGQLFALSNRIGSLSDLAVQYDDPTRSHLTLASAAGTPVALSGIAPATLSALSTDAVNGGQLYDTNQAVAGLQTLVTNQGDQYQTLNNQFVTLNTQVATGSVGPVRYSSALDPINPNGGVISQDLTLVGAGAGPVGLHNVADATLSALSADAVTGAQLFATNQNVTDLRTDLGGQASQLTTLNLQVANTTTALGDTNSALNQLNVQVSNGGIGPVQYSSSTDPTTPNGGVRSQDLTLVGLGSGAVALHNVAAGTLSMTSLDAVNGSQLVGLGNATANLFGGNYAYNAASNSFTGSLSYGGNSYASVQAALGAIQDSVSINGGSSDGSIPASTKYFHTTSTMTDSTALGSDSTAIGPTSTSTGVASISVGRNSSAMGDSSVAIGDGAMAQDGKAVSIGVGNMASGDGAVSIGDPNVATGQGATALGKDNTSTGDGAVAMGYVNTANQDGSAAIGYRNSANGVGAVALGESNSATGAGAIAIGSDNNVVGEGSLALGNNIRTGANDTLAIGSSTSALAERALALGNRAAARSVDTLAVGTDSSASGQSASAIGISALASGAFSAVFGSNASALSDYAMALGPQSMASSEGALAIGSLSQASGFASTAVGSGSMADEDGSVALGSATKTVRGVNTAYSAFGLATAQNSQGEVAIARNLSYLDPATGLQTPTGERQITGLAAGSADTDAVNVSQLRGVSSTLGSAFATGLGGGATYNSATGQLAAPSYTFGGVTYTNVGDALTALATTGTGTGTGGGTGTPTAPTNMVSYATPDHSTVALATTGTVVQNVAAGEVSATSTDAVNGSQLNATNQQVSQLSTQVSNGAVGVVRYANATTPTQSNGGTQTNDATLVGANTAAPVALHNVASGTVAEASTDAVNGGQLYATNQAVSRAQSTADTAMTMGQNSVQYDSTTPNAVTLGNTGTGAVALHNVAAGQSASDAVNVGQMNSALSSAVSEANGYTDGRIAALAFDLRKVSRTANAGTAGAMALAGMPQPYEAGKGMVSMGMATYQGQTAIAFGAARAFNDGHTVMKVGATYNSSGAVGASVGAGYQF